ncbi:MAG TPA: elongation factor G, partial [Pontiella sp.]
MGADFSKVISAMKEKLGAHPVVIQLPIGAAETFSGVIDLVKMRGISFSDEDLGTHVAYTDIPSELAAEAEKARAELIEKVAEVDEELLEAY